MRDFTNLFIECQLNFTCTDLFSCFCVYKVLYEITDCFVLCCPSASHSTIFQKQIFFAVLLLYYKALPIHISQLKNNIHPVPVYRAHSQVGAYVVVLFSAVLKTCAWACVMNESTH